MSTTIRGPEWFSAIRNFSRYNVAGTLQPLRILLALLIRLWQTFGYLHLLILTVATVFAMWLPALPAAGQDGARPRIALNTQLALLSVILAYVFAMAIIGGAELARYMLPVGPSACHSHRHFDTLAASPLVARCGSDHCADVCRQLVR